MAAKRVEIQPLFENCRIIFRNFSGKQTQYNREGDRNFCVVIDDLDTAKKMLDDGWNIRYLTPSDEGDEEVPIMKVAVSYNNIPPTIVLVSSSGRTVLDESTIHILDTAEIETVDLIVNPYNWEVNGKSGVKAYVKKMYVVLKEDALTKKYANFDISDPSDDVPFL